jgi:hypothetical protein
VERSVRSHEVTASRTDNFVSKVFFCSRLLILDCSLASIVGSIYIDNLIPGTLCP